VTPNPWQSLTYHDYLWAVALQRDFDDALAWCTPVYQYDTED
jgi:hypothetical protein